MKRPYSPSWVDRFQDWLVGLPIPIWLSLLFIYLLTALSFHAAAWIDGVLPAGALGDELLFNALWGAVALMFIVALDRGAKVAMQKFGELVPGKKREIELLLFQMTNIPSRPALFLTGFMVLLIGSGIYFDPSFIYAGMSNPISYVLILPFTIFSYAFAPLLIYQGFRLLNLIRKAYRLPGDINLFQLQPLYAFSSVTMTSGFFWLLIMNMNLVGNYFLVESTQTSVAFTLIFITPAILLAFLSFLYPLWGIHRRIQDKKENALQENGRQIDNVHQTLYRHLGRNDHRHSNDLEKSLSSLYRMREQIERVPTWPWRPGTFRNFLSAVFLPLGLWLVQQALIRLL